MNLSEQLKALNEFDLADLDMENIGSWPLVLKGIVLVLLYVVILVAGFYLHVDDLNIQLRGVEQEEQTLRQDFEKKAFEAANLEAYKAQLVEMEQRFGALVIGNVDDDGVALASASAPMASEETTMAKGFRSILLLLVLLLPLFLLKRTCDGTTSPSTSFEMDLERGHLLSSSLVPHLCRSSSSLHY